MTKQSKLTVLFVALFLALACVLIILIKNSHSNNPKELPSAIKEITLNDIKSHNTKTSCWTIIDQSVYDITPYINNHPGGDAILNACGIIGTDLFNNRQDNSGNLKDAHSPVAREKLAAFRIGILAP